MPDTKPTPLAPQSGLLQFDDAGPSWDQIAALPSDQRAAVMKGLLDFTGNPAENKAVPTTPEKPMPQDRRGLLNGFMRPDEMMALASGLLGAEPGTQGMGAGLGAMLKQQNFNRTMEFEKDKIGLKNPYSDLKIDDNGNVYGMDKRTGQYGPIPSHGMKGYTKFKTVQGTDNNGRPVMQLVDPSDPENRITVSEKVTNKDRAVLEANLALMRNNLQVVRDLLFDEQGNVDRANAATKWVPWSEGRTGKQAIKNIVEIILRLRTGAAAPEHEVINYADMFGPSLLDSNEGARIKYNNMLNFIQDAEEALKTGEKTTLQELRTKYNVQGQNLPTNPTPATKMRGVYNVETGKIEWQ